jgi:putative transposase
MARLPRYFVKGVPLHIILRGNNRDPIFANDDDYQFFRECLLDAAKRHGLTIHAYVFMTNHIHMLASRDSENSVPKTMQSVGGAVCSISIGITSALGHCGRAATGQQSSMPIECMRYIELNPVRAGMVVHPRQYSWSSYRCNAEGRADALVSPHSLYRGLAREENERQGAYRTLVKATMDVQTIDTIRTCTNKGWALWSGKFQSKIERLAERRAAPMSKGRPKSIKAD